MDNKVVIKSVCKHKRDGPLPTIVKFQNGTLAGISDHNAQFCALVAKERKRKRVLVAAGRSIYTGDVQENELYETYLCVRNKKTNEAHLMPVAEALLSNNVYRELEQQNKKPLLDKDHASKKLLKEFGGRKGSRFASTRDAMSVNMDMLRKDLDETVQESIQPDDFYDDDTLGNIDNTEYLASITPKFDKNATTVKDIYDVEDVVPRTVLEKLDKEAKVVFATPLESLPLESEYLRDALKCIQAKEIPSRKDFLNIKLIMFMDALQTLILMHKRQMKKVELSRISECVENDIRQRFADPLVAKSFTRTGYTIEKALTHFIVLALLISDNFEVNVNVLSSTLRVSKKRIVTFAHIVNARLKSRSEVLSLHLPSKMPHLPTGGRFRRKK
ncbi:uncharacterized protein LOC115621353 [Scaptodrosophila lebanonensis]|uniref:Uncharacterized protein LOC115621353 n=1 Tax=Drosophila lebanonensis TaxID=7225 RepID=A0A6J2T1Q1_DROLE|nr:uncharacterized protein LOC115621353 [Scaptodrosophila lebanonensis]